MLNLYSKKDYLNNKQPSFKQRYLITVFEKIINRLLSKQNSVLIKPAYSISLKR